MPRRMFFMVFLVGVSSLLFGLVMFNRHFSVVGAGPRLHKIELSEYGVRLINSADPTYESAVTGWLLDRNLSFDQLAVTLKPFSVLVDNTTDKDILAYKLNWEMKMKDGSVVNYPRSYFAPTYLMGVPRSDLYDNMMASIKKNSNQFFAMIPTPSDALGKGSGAGSIRIRSDEIEKFRSAARNNDMTPLIAKISEQIDQATDITVSIESVLFDDGAFVGPTSDREFIKMKAYMTAKRDLYEAIRTASRERKRPLNSVLSEVERTADHEVEMPTPDSPFGVHYNFYRKLHAQEIKGSRRAFGDDEKTVKLFVSMLNSKWIIPHDQIRPDSNK